MQDPKALKFFEETLSKTRSGKIGWEPTADDQTFIAAIGGKFTLSLLHEMDQWQQHEYALILKDEAGRELLSVRGSDGGISVGDMIDLYQLARRQALQVDAKLDALFGEFDKL